MSRARGRVLLPALCLLGAGLFAALGIWQVERRAWKLDLIARVEARLAASPIDLPPTASWSELRPRDIEYRRVRVRGRFLHDRATLVDALTERGAGFWVMTPFAAGDGVVMVNRGFVPRALRRSVARPAGHVTITGLLRASEPHGRILRPNRPREGLWYSRDVEAIAAARGIANPAPFFVDADATPNPNGYPIGGLTVIRFRNAHFAYALTWFALAGLCVAGLVIVKRNEADR